VAALLLPFETASWEATAGLDHDGCGPLADALGPTSPCTRDPVHRVLPPQEALVGLRGDA